MCAKHRNVITDVLPDIDAVVAALSDGLVDAPEELRARVGLAYLTTYVDADASDLEGAVEALRARAGGTRRQLPSDRASPPQRSTTSLSRPTEQSKLIGSTSRPSSRSSSRRGR